MKIIKKSPTTISLRNKVITLTVMLGIGLIGLFFLEKNNITNIIHGTPTLNDEQQIEKTINSARKKSLIEDSATNTNSAETKTPPTIKLSAEQEGDETVTVLTKLYGISSGSCQLGVTNGNKSTSQSVNIIYQPEFSSCAGFSVPISTLGSGPWSISVTVTSGTETNTENTTLEVRP